MNARVADAEGRVGDAAAGYARALGAAPGDTAVALRAYRQGLAAGDETLVRGAARTLAGTPAAPADLALIALSNAARADDVAAFDTAIAALDGGVLKIMAPSLRAWSALARGADPSPALAAAGKAGTVAVRLAEETRALAAIARGDVAGGVALIETLRAGGSPIDLRLAGGELLFGQHRDVEARALLTGDDALLVGMRAGAAARPGLAFGTARLLVRVAADLTGQGPTDLSIALTSAALRADPRYDRARLLIAGALARDGATDRALAVLAKVARSSPAADAATTGRIAILAAANRDDEALAVARGAATERDANAADWRAYADRLAAANRFAEAASWYHRLVDAPATRASWSAWLQYGGALDRAGDWPGARTALQRAVALGPTEPLALNYLGYASAEHGDDLPRAIAMLARARGLAPDNGSIVDSLGWAYRLGGDPARALPLIERAAAGDPANAEIGEHLGDVYWLLGRRYEARYAWAAAALTAEQPDAARIVAKQATGLPPR